LRSCLYLLFYFLFFVFYVEPLSLSQRKVLRFRSGQHLEPAAETRDCATVGALWSESSPMIIRHQSGYRVKRCRPADWFWVGQPIAMLISPMRDPCLSANCKQLHCSVHELKVVSQFKFLKLFLWTQSWVIVSHCSHSSFTSTSGLFSVRRCGLASCIMHP